ncbi:hypothetical protein P8C59_000451 [Phyllachora maydis]|uniref:Peroxin 11C n=1 Tax=Phyllachora maydis TaxID=1825666 RepID=A0AAD9HXN7_9PEZI|nr:hypothetical protein P8C59_000451 [Phyllachora maydis]
MAEPATTSPTVPPTPPSPSSPAPLDAALLRPAEPTGPLRAAAARTDAFLAHLNRCLATPSGIDTVLLFVCYTSRLAAAVLPRLSRSALRRSARERLALPPPPAALVSSLAPPAVAKGDAGRGGGPAARALRLSLRLKALSLLLSEARMNLRLWALLGMYFWGRGLLMKLRRARRTGAAPQHNQPAAAGGPGEEKPTKEEREDAAADTAVAWLQLATCVVFQALENGAYLSAKGVLGWSPAAQARAYKWSARFWAVYTGVELGRLAGEALRDRDRDRDRDRPRGAGQTAAWRAQVARNLAWAPLTVHWSMDEGFVGEAMVGLLGSVPGLIQMRALWRDTA